MNPTPLMRGYDSALATGGALASGKAGFSDAQNQATAVTRTYDDFWTAVPAADAVVFSGRSAEIRHDSAIRQDSSGTYYGSIHTYRGGRFYLTPDLGAGHVNEVFAKVRRNDIDVAADDQIADSTTITVHYVPKYLVAPR